MEPALKLEYYDQDYLEVELPLQEKKKPHLKKKRMPIPMFICIVATLIVGSAIFYLNQQVVSMQLNVQINNLERQLADLVQEHNHMLMSLEQTTRLSYIESVARNELGMINPSNTEMLVMNNDGSHSHENSGWIDNDPYQPYNLFTVVADWFNQLMPVGGVEAGRIGQ